jgi:hypothetical protein
MTNSFLISENGLVLFQISGGGMGALTQLGAECLAIKFVSTRGPPPFFDSFAPLAIFGEAKSTVLKAFKTEDVVN